MIIRKITTLKVYAATATDSVAARGRNCIHLQWWFASNRLVKITDDRP